MGRNTLFLFIYLLNKYFLSVYYNVGICARHWDSTVNKALSLSSRNGEPRTGCRQEIDPLQFRADREEVQQGSTRRVSTSVLGCQLAPYFSFFLDSF